MFGAVPATQAAITNYNVITTFYEPDTQPRDSIFIGSFAFDDVTKTVSNLQGILSESMTGDPRAYPNDNMTWLPLNYQLSAVYDATLGGLLVTTFKNSSTNTFSTMLGGDGWSPQAGVNAGGVYYGFPKAASNPGNAYATIFVNTTDPLAPLTQAQLDKLAYADCAPGGMMGAVCMTGTSATGYGSVGTMSGYPKSQVITAPVAPASLNLTAGWNLLGNGANAPLDVASVLGDAAKVSTVWKWVPATSKWAFYTPSLQAQALTDYATSKGYDVLTSINGGEGFWVNAKQPFTAGLPTGNTVLATDLRSTLITGWNLVAIGETKTPAEFNAASAPINLTTLWAWESSQSAWYFYAPSLAASGALSSYITSKNYLDFTASSKMLGQGVGFWVNRP